MKAGVHLDKWLSMVNLTLIIGVLSLGQLSYGQNRNDRSNQRAAPPPSHAEQRQSRPEPSRPQSRPQYTTRPEFQPRSRPEPQRQYQPPPRPYQPPTEGHHSGQWLNQHREQPLDQQRRALQNDPQFRRLPAERQQRFEQNLRHFDSLPADRQQQVLRRMETWEHLTPQQKQDFRSMDSEYKGLPADRRQAVRNAIESLRAMPPDARQRQIQSGRYNEFSPQERQILNNASRLPLAPAEPPSRSEQGGPEQPPSTQPRTGPGRYIPRPPH